MSMTTRSFDSIDNQGKRLTRWVSLNYYFDMLFGLNPAQVTTGSPLQDYETDYAYTVILKPAEE